MKNSVSFEYIAGFFDGEGCIHIHKGPAKGTGHLEIILVNSNKLILEKVKEFLNLGTVRPHGYLLCWRALCQEAKQILINILPFLQIKREQASFAIEFQNLKMNSGNPLSLKERNYRENLRKKINKMNSRRRAGSITRWVKVSKEEAEKIKMRTQKSS